MASSDGVKEPRSFLSHSVGFPSATLVPVAKELLRNLMCMRSVRLLSPLPYHKEENGVDQAGLTSHAKALKAQIVLEMVTPQMLQMPNIWQASGQPLSQDGQQGQQPVVQTLPGLPPLAQNKMQFGLMPRVQEGQISSLHPNSLAHSQYSALPQLPTHPQVKLPQLPLNQVLQQEYKS